jgi:putative SOS response-associated peptidase YedK
VKAINARAETLAEKPAFRDAFQRRRCIVPMRGFYEWQKAGRGKIPHFCRLTHADLFAVAGLYEYWPGVEGGGPMETFTVITTDANSVVAKLHDRMPAILQESDYDAWLDPENRNAESLKPKLNPYPADQMRVYPVSTNVNRVENDDDTLIREAAQPERDLFGSLPQRST